MGRVPKPVLGGYQLKLANDVFTSSSPSLQKPQAPRFMGDLYTAQDFSQERARKESSAPGFFRDPIIAKDFTSRMGLLAPLDDFKINSDWGESFPIINKFKADNPIIHIHLNNESRIRNADIIEAAADVIWRIKEKVESYPDPKDSKKRAKLIYQCMTEVVSAKGNKIRFTIDDYEFREDLLSDSLVDGVLDCDTSTYTAVAVAHELGWNFLRPADAPGHKMSAIIDPKHKNKVLDYIDYGQEYKAKDYTEGEWFDRKLTRYSLKTTTYLKPLSNRELNGHALALVAGVIMYDESKNLKTRLAEAETLLTQALKDSPKSLYVVRMNVTVQRYYAYALSMEKTNKDPEEVKKINEELYARLRKAKLLLEEVAKKDATDEKAYIELAKTCLYLKEPELAIQYFEKTYSLTRDVKYLFEIGKILHAQGKPDEIKSLMGRMLNDVGNFMTWVMVGDLYVFMNDHENAFQAYSKSLEMGRELKEFSPDFGIPISQILVKMAGVRYKIKKDFKGTIALYEQALNEKDLNIAKTPNEARINRVIKANIYYQISTIYIFIAESDDKKKVISGLRGALAAMERAAELHPDHPQYSRHIEYLKARLGRFRSWLADHNSVTAELRGSLGASGDILGSRNDIRAALYLQARLPGFTLFDGKWSLSGGVTLADLLSTDFKNIDNVFLPGFNLSARWHIVSLDAGIHAAFSTQSQIPFADPVLSAALNIMFAANGKAGLNLQSLIDLRDPARLSYFGLGLNFSLGRFEENYR